jgi:uncharacterized membrane protein
MAEDKPSFWDKIKSDPATGALMDSVKSFASAQAGNVTSAGIDKLSGKQGSGAGVGGAVQGVTDAAGQGKGRLGTLWGGIKGGIKGLFSRKGKGGGKGGKRPNNIVEDVWIGAPVEVVFDKWTRYEDWAGFTKGVDKVNEENAKDKAKDQQAKAEQDGKTDKSGKTEDKPDVQNAQNSKSDQEKEDEQVLNWTARIFWSRRSWKSHTSDQEQNQYIRWNSEGPKGIVEGIVTFTPMGENLTLVLVVIEYRGKGLMEWLGNRWRVVGRRVRLDLKHFRRFAMTSAADEHLMPKPDDEESEDDQDSEEPEDSVDSVEPEDSGEPDDEQGDDGEDESGEESEADTPEEPEPEARPRRREKAGAR